MYIYVYIYVYLPICTCTYIYIMFSEIIFSSMKAQETGNFNDLIS